MQLVDYDRHNNTYTKLKDKKEKTLKDEQSLFKVEQDFEAAAADYEYYNNAMKEELPRFFQLGTQFITPLFHSFYYMQYVSVSLLLKSNPTDHSYFRSCLQAQRLLPDARQASVIRRGQIRHFAGRCTSRGQLCGAANGRG